VALAPRAPEQLHAEARAASQSHRFLSHAEYLARHAPLEGDYNNIRAFLGGASGIRVTRTRAERNSLDLTGTVADMERLFGTAINRYQYQGREFFANATN